MWVISNLPPEEAIEIYKLRMKIEESFRDLKDLLSIDKIMNQKQENMEKMASMVLLSYSIGLLIGEGIREVEYTGKKRKLYSGKLKKQVTETILIRIVYSDCALFIFHGVVNKCLKVLMTDFLLQLIIKMKMKAFFSHDL